MKQNIRPWFACSVTARGGHPVLRTICVLIAALLVSALPGLAECQDQPSGPIQALPIEIVGNSAADEGTERQWVAVLRERPIENSAKGYKPTFSAAAGSSGPLPVKYECAIEFRWNFGDDTDVISTGERPSITHAYPDSGDFTLRVEAWSQGRVFARGEKVVKVRNRPPRFPLVSAVEIDPATSTFEFTALATDVEGDPLTYEWDFGDGQTEVNDQWRMEHAYQHPGRYTVKVNFKDDEDEAREGKRDILVTGAANANDDSVIPLEERPTGAAQTSINLSINGGIDFNFTGEIRPVAGIFLAPHKPQGCRFLFTAWDNANLAHIGFIVDLKGLRKDGAIYKINKPDMWLNLEPERKIYEHGKSFLTGANVIGPEGLGAFVNALPGVAGLSDEQRRTIGNQAGVEPGEREHQETTPTPSTSPFGLDDHEGFKTEEGEAGLLFIPYDRAVGRIQVKLRNPDKKSPYQTMIVNGDFVLDLQAARRDGLMIYDDCGPADLQIERVNPEDKETFLYTRTPNVSVYFSDRYAVESLNSDTFQLTYPAPGHGELVPVDVRLYRRDKSAWIRPTKDLMGGVRYTARIKIGEGGVLDRGGNPIPDENGTQWYTWSFTTRPNLAPDKDSAPGTENLSCQVFQTVRDAPLIAGKPAVARIYANWQWHPEVHPDAQLREFTGRVALIDGNDEIATDFVRFVRPDLWTSEGIHENKAEHTANLFFTPRANLPTSLRVKLEMPSDIGDTAPPTAWSRCSTPMWKLSPKIKVQWYLLNVNEWYDKDIEAEVKPWVEQIIAGAKTLAQQLFPVASVEMQYGGVMPYPPLIPDRQAGLHRNCSRACGDVVMQYWQESPVFSAIGGVEYDATSTMLIGIVPVRAAGSAAGSGADAGGSTFQRIGGNGPARIVFAFEDEPSYRDRFIFGVVHEMGHALWLEHLPWIETDYAQDESQRLRDEAWANGNSPFKYEGIEGFLIAPDGKSGKNKSSTEGNEESSWLSTLMYPSTLNPKDIFIARHHYLQLMQTWETNGGISKPR